MPIYSSKIVIDIATNRVELKRQHRFIGDWLLCKGASAEQEQLAQKQAAFYDTLTKDYQTQFAQQSAILDSLNKSFEPILQAGPGQYGYTTAEDTALRTQASEGTSKQYTDAAKAVGGSIAAAGGGDAFLPSGAATQMKEQLGSAAAGQEASSQLGITQGGYERGYQQYLAAANILGGSAAQYSPTGYAGQASTAGSDAFSSATEIQKMKNASSLWGTVGGMLGGAVSAFAGGMGSGVGAGIGKSIGG